MQRAAWLQRGGRAAQGVWWVGRARVCGRPGAAKGVCWVCVELWVVGSSVEVDSSVTTCSAARVFSAGSWYTSGGSARRAACSFAASSSSSMLLLSIPSTAASDRGISVSERVLDEKQSATLIRRQVRLNWRQHSASSDCSPFSLPDSPLSKRTSNRLKMSRSKSSSRRSRSWQRKRGERRGSRGAISHSVGCVRWQQRALSENSCKGPIKKKKRPTNKNEMKTNTNKQAQKKQRRFRARRQQNARVSRSGTTSTPTQ